MSDKYIEHFNVKIKKSPKIYINIEEYCNYTDKIGSIEKNLIKKITFNYECKEGKEKEKYLNAFNEYLKFPNSHFKDKEHFADEYMKNHINNIKKNYELNMKYFDKLDFTVFNKKLLNFVKKNKFKETIDLYDLSEMSGIYIMVLDKYKQVYIGQSTDMKKRIQGHWSQKMEFQRLIWGNVNTSILSINSFGALDTTRIFYKEIPHYELHNKEEQYVSKFDSQYMLNRTAGGINGEYDKEIRSLKVLANAKERKL